MTTHTDPSHKLESNVKSYARSFPFVATSAKGATIIAEDGAKYLDFLSGAGTLNYGHNNDQFKQAIIDYIEEDGIVHGLDIATKAKNRFIETFSKIVLEPRDLDYRLQNDHCYKFQWHNLTCQHRHQCHYKSLNIFYLNHLRHILRRKDQKLF